MYVHICMYICMYIHMYAYMDVDMDMDMDIWGITNRSELTIEIHQHMQHTASP